jgi:hypothetical protein
MLQNSPEAMTSTTAVWTAMATISPPPTCCFALFVEFRQLLKKYVALFLCMMSKSVPPMSDRKLKPLPPGPFRHQNSAIARPVSRSLKATYPVIKGDD